MILREAGWWGEEGETERGWGGRKGDRGSGREGWMGVAPGVELISP